MPLSQNDPALDYDGSWGDASKDWPHITFASEEIAKKAYVIAWRDAKVPYGSYVLVGNDLRLETVELKALVQRFVDRLMPQSGVGWILYRSNPVLKPGEKPMSEIVKRFYSTADIKTLIEACHRTARNHGWWSLTNGNVDFEVGDVEEKIVLIISELSEAFEEYRKPDVDILSIYAVGSAGMLPWEEKHSKMEPMPKPEGFPVEMADAYIRLCDLAGALGVLDVEEIMVPTDGSKHKVGQHIYRLMKTALDDDEGVDASYFGSLFAAIEGTCRELGIDLDRAIALKMRYNETRPRRHGNKRA